MRSDSGARVGLWVLTGHWPEHIRDEDLHQGLVQDVVTAPHPLEDGLVLAQSDQFVLWEGPFGFLFAAGGGGERRQS